MKPIDYIKKIALHACIYYTAATFFLLFLYWLLNLNLDRGMNPIALICILPFAICFATGNICMTDCKWSTYLKVLVHYTLTVGGAFLCLYLPNRADGQTAAQGFILFMALSVIYTVVMAIIAFVRARIHRVDREQKAYTGVYKKK